MPLRIRTPSIAAPAAPPSTSIWWLNVAGTWKQGTVWIRVAGVWKQATRIWFNNAGTWK